MRYLVDIAMPAYNHARFIGQALEGIVQQRTHFGFRVFVADDCSKDNTREIVLEYAAKYPDIVIPVFREKNLGPSANGYELIRMAESKYMAICEGDDYWIDPYKLQKQVDFLEANPDYSLCFSDIELLDEVGTMLDEYYPRKGGETYTIEDFIMSGRNIIPTPTLIYRNQLPDPMPDFYLKCMSGDLFIQIYMAHLGKAKYIPEKLAVYRNHSQGFTKSEESIQKSRRATIELFKEINKYLDYKYDAIFRRRLLEFAKSNLIFEARNKKGLAKLKHYFKALPEYLKYSDGINWKELLYYHVLLFFPFVLKLKKAPAQA